MAQTPQPPPVVPGEGSDAPGRSDGRGARGHGVRDIGRRAMVRALRIVPEPRRFVLEEGLGRLPPGRYPIETEPPPTPAGRETGLPDFIGVGVQKAATSWWFALLTSQPEIHNEPGFRKERHFFDRFFDAELGPSDVETYRRWFPRPRGTLAGEWTPCYLFHFWVPPLLARIVPEARLLVLLRDPVERYRSGLTHESRHARLPRFSYADEAFQRGLYGAQLARLRALVAPERILVLQQERCRIDVEGQLRRTLDFLGVEGTATRSLDTSLAQRAVNVTRRTKVTVPGAVREELVARYRADIDLLVTMYPEIDLDLWPTVSST